MDMHRPNFTRATARALAIALLAIVPAACYVTPYPYGYTVPANYDRSYDAVMGAMADNGLSIILDDRGAGRAVGRRGGMDVNGAVLRQGDGSVRVEFTTSGATAQDPQLIDRVTRSYNARMGR